MRTRVSDMLGVEFPILAFSHCRDVVAAVKKTGAKKATAKKTAKRR